MDRLAVNFRPCLCFQIPDNHSNDGHLNVLDCVQKKTGHNVYACGRIVENVYSESCLVVCFITFVACLVLPLEIGILVGIGVNLLFILYHAARPKISVEKLQTTTGTDYLLLTPDRCLIFPSVDYVRNLVTKQSIRQGIPVVIDCTHIYGADYTAATVIDTLTQDFAARDQPLLFYNLKPSVCTVFEGLSPKDFIVFYDEDQIDDLLIERDCIKKENEILGV